MDYNIEKDSKEWIKKNIVSEDYIKRSITRFTEGNIVLIGMRRLGKTEYLKYRLSLIKKDDVSIQITTYDGDYSSTSESESGAPVLFVDFDNPRFSTVDFDKKDSTSFAEVTNQIMDLLDSGRYETLMIDEIQRRPEWTKWLKGMVDKYNWITFIATGSDAAAIGEETGLDRFQIIEIGVLSFNEYLNLSSLQILGRDKFRDYINDPVMPGKSIREDVSLQYESVYEKQYKTKNFKLANISAIMNWISVNPGSQIKVSKLTASINEKYNTSISDEQVKKIIGFLEDSKMIFSLGDSYTGARRKVTKKVYYTTNWNVYKFATKYENYNDLGTDTVPRSGLIYENAVISSIRSTLFTKQEISNLKFYEKDNVDCDFELYGDKYEIKSFDVFSGGHAPELAKLVNIKSKLTITVLHEGETKFYKGIQFISTTEFLKGESWKQKTK